VRGNAIMKKVNKKPPVYWQKCRKKERQRRIDLIKQYIARYIH